MTVALGPSPKFRALTALGAPLAGGKLHTYLAGGTTPAATYINSTGGTPNANPVILDANGEANIWFTDGVSYRLVLADASDVVQWTVDHYSAQQTGAAGTAGTQILSVQSQFAVTGPVFMTVTVQVGSWVFLALFGHTATAAGTFEILRIRRDSTSGTILEASNEPGYGQSATLFHALQASSAGDLTFVGQASVASTMWCIVTTGT